MTNKKILIIDDTKDLNDMFSLAFEWAGFSVQQSFGGKDGFDVYQKFQPNVILLDILMPEMDGNKVLARIQKGNPHHPLIIIFSNLEWKGAISKKVRYIKKSNITSDNLVEQVKRWLENTHEEEIPLFLNA